MLYADIYLKWNVHLYTHVYLCEICIYLNRLYKQTITWKFNIHLINLPRTHLCQSTTKSTKWSNRQQRLKSVWASTQSDESLPSAWRRFEALASQKLEQTLISMGIRPVWWAFAVSMNKVSVLSFPKIAQQRFDQTRGMPRLIWVFAALFLLCSSSF